MKDMYQRFFARMIFTLVIIGSSIFLEAQICNGSLGDPVVNITFGNGAPGTSGYSAPSSYTYTSISCPNDGYYTITRSTSGCFNNSWHTLTSDHTGNGAFLLVNATNVPGDFFLTNVTNLCPNTTYEFAAWIANVLNKSGIKPNITFKIEATDGTILQQYSTGDIPETPTPDWKQYGFFFTTPANNAVIVLRMTNNAPGGSGNDIAMDDITFRPCSPATITAAIQNNNDTVHVCEGNSNVYSLQGAVTAGYTSPVFQWQVSTDSGQIWKDIAGANTTSYQRMPTVVSSYWYRLTVIERAALANTACRISSDILAINVHAKPAVSAGPDKTMIAGNPIQLDGVVSGENPSYYWAPPDFLNDMQLLQPMADPPADKKYTLFASTPYGCSNQDTVYLKVVGGIYIPNAFTANKDSKNDHWRIPFLDPSFGANVNVYNRFGQIVYHVQGGVVDWDGTFKGELQPSGTYVYHIRFRNGYPDMKGSFILIR
jgi:gliding motility-associated-like protein